MQQPLTDRLSISIARRETSLDDAALVARSIRDPHAFAPLYARYLGPVHRYCYRRLGSREAAEDATSRIFEKALRGLPGFRGRSFRAWLFSIAHNVVIDDIRSARPGWPLTAAAWIPDPAPSPEDRVLARECRRSCDELLEALSDEQRHVVLLRLAGLTGREIADVVGRSHAWVRTTQMRAYARLRARIEDHRGQDRWCDV